MNNLQEPTIQNFIAKQQPPSGKWWVLLFFMLGFAGPIIGGEDSKFGYFFMVLCLSATVVSGFICWQKGRCEIQTDKNGLNLKMVKAGFRLPLGENRFIWQDLEWFKYDGGTVDSNPDLELKWLNHPIQTFEDDDIKALGNYLHKYFPEKEQEAPKVRFG